jgi:hypothetical protein
MPDITLRGYKSRRKIQYIGFGLTGRVFNVEKTLYTTDMVGFKDLILTSSVKVFRN